MDYFLIPLTALLASLLTFFSGFGLGTMLTPVMAVFFPIEEAIFLTGIVHLSNNLFKILLTGKSVNVHLLMKFGLPAIGGAFIGAQVLFELQDSTLMYYHLFGKEFEISLLGLTAGAVILFFALWEVIPALNKMEIDTKWIMPGGLLSGFFGGLTGHQGALRSAFLIRFKLNKESFIATGIGIACLIDLTRLPTYMREMNDAVYTDRMMLLIVSALAAFSGAYLGNRYLKKTTLDTVQKTVTIMLVLISLLLMSGII
jgi:uncharacterized membrane protein YfcA